MKCFSFSLEKVLGYKTQCLTILKNDFSKLRTQLDKVIDEIEQKKKIYTYYNDQLISSFSTGLTPSEISTYKIYLNQLSENITLLILEKKKIEHAIALKKEEIVKANTEISSLEKLKEKQLEEYKKVEQKGQELFINEFINNAQFSKA